MTKERVTWPEAFAEEKAVIKKRRNEDREDKLVGLAISGGGIRSATFALGVLEGLKRLGLLPKIDYLSTVSGGGYIGAWLSANCLRTQKQKDATPWLEQSANWDQSVAHLRRYSNYLSPTLGFFSADTWSMGAIWLRNTILVQITVMLALAVILLVPRLLFPLFSFWPNVENWRWATIFLYVLGAVGIAGNHLRMGRQKGPVVFLKGDLWPVGLGLATVLFGAAWWLGAVTHFEPFTDQSIGLYPSVPMAFFLVAGGFCLQPVIVKLVSQLPGKDAPKQINYTQAWVQWLVVIPMLAVGFLVAAILWGQGQIGALADTRTYGWLFLNAWHYWSFPLAIVFVSLWLFALCSVRDFRDWKCWGVAMLIAPAPALIALHAMLCGILYLFKTWAFHHDQGEWTAYVWGPTLVLFTFSFAAVVLIGMMGRQSSEGVREWWSRFGSWLGIYGFGWMLISLAVSYGPWLSAGLAEKALGLSVGGGWVASTLGGLLAGNSESTGKPQEKSTISTILDWAARVAPFIFIAGLLVAVSSVLHLTILSNSDLDWNNAADLHQRHWPLMTLAKQEVVWSVFGLCLAGFLLFAWRVDINEFSLNAFYRSRLVRCYLGATRFRLGERHPQNFTGFDEKDDLRLATLVEQHASAAPAGPFHIVNCALNLGGSKDLSLHTRHSANFTLTALRCGSKYRTRTQTNESREIGYWATAKYGGMEGQPTLGQAISVSGAAASPNMGYHTSPIVAFVMTLFNVRLGWWFPNPDSKGVNRPSPLFSLRYLLKELFGGANDKSSYLAISDGGHFENLAAYELVKRRCRIIIISDGECDPHLRFEGLGTLIRMCEVDFGAKIDIDVNAIRSGESEWSSRCAAVGTIEYAGGARGTLIYLKAALTADEATGILQYKSAHPEFPHESTGNQFYTEDQFESYRALGHAIAYRTLEPVAKETDFGVLGDKLEKICSPSLHDPSTFTKHAGHLMDLWSKLSDNENLGFLDKEFVGTWPEAPAAGFRPAYYICCEMLQLMENVYLDLRLEETWNHADNTGWRTTFLRWAGSPAIQRAWRLSAPTFGLRFQYFCERNLNLPLPD